MYGRVLRGARPEMHTDTNVQVQKIEQRTAPYAAFLLRLTLGSPFIAHLYWKFAILPGRIEKWWSSLEANGYHWLVPTYSISAELTGSVLLIPGIYTRWVSLYAIPLMIGAAHFWLVRRGFYFTAAARTPSTLQRYRGVDGERRPSRCVQMTHLEGESAQNSSPVWNTAWPAADRSSRIYGMGKRG
jgi:uncharacterized membrane protein YphA (DoxX/SURF4 family)